MGGRSSLVDRGFLSRSLDKIPPRKTCHLRCVLFASSFPVEFVPVYCSGISVASVKAFKRPLSSPRDKRRWQQRCEKVRCVHEAKVLRSYLRSWAPRSGNRAGMCEHGSLGAGGLRRTPNDHVASNVLHLVSVHSHQLKPHVDSFM